MGSSQEKIALMGRELGTAMMRGNEKTSTGRAVEIAEWKKVEGQARIAAPTLLAITGFEMPF